MKSGTVENQFLMVGSASLPSLLHQLMARSLSSHYVLHSPGSPCRITNQPPCLQAHSLNRCWVPFVPPLLFAAYQYKCYMLLLVPLLFLHYLCQPKIQSCSCSSSLGTMNVSFTCCIQNAREGRKAGDWRGSSKVSTRRWGGGGCWQLRCSEVDVRAYLYSARQLDSGQVGVMYH